MPEDVGWMQYNPTPYVILPIAVGARYGFMAGVQGGFMAYLLLGMTRTIFGMDNFVDFVEQNGYLFFGMLITGGIAGELEAYHRRRHERYQALHEETSKRMRKLDVDLHHVMQVNDELQKKIVSANNQTVSLDMQIRKLYEADLEDIYQTALLILNRLEKISSAAIYLIDIDGRLQRNALIGDEEEFPEEMFYKDYQIIEKSLDLRKMVALPNLFDDQPEIEEPYLVSIPFTPHHSDPIAVLVINKMPFSNFNPDTLKRIKVVSEWMAEIIMLRADLENFRYRVASGSGNKRIFYSDFLMHNLNRAFESYEDHAIESMVIFMYSPEDNTPDLFEMEGLLMKMVRNGDFAIHLPLNHPHLCIFLPFTGERGASLFAKRCSAMFSNEFPELGDLEVRTMAVKDYEDTLDLYTNMREGLT